MYDDEAVDEGSAERRSTNIEEPGEMFSRGGGDDDDDDVDDVKGTTNAFTTSTLETERDAAERAVISEDESERRARPHMSVLPVKKNELAHKRGQRQRSSADRSRNHPTIPGPFPALASLFACP